MVEAQQARLRAITREQVNAFLGEHGWRCRDASRVRDRWFKGGRNVDVFGTTPSLTEADLDIIAEVENAPCACWILTAMAKRSGVDAILGELSAKLKPDKGSLIKRAIELFNETDKQPDDSEQ